MSHVNKRVKHQSEIGLPLLELWKLYTEANATPMVKNFCIVYIEMAFERADVKVHASASVVQKFYSFFRVRIMLQADIFWKSILACVIG